MVRGVRLGLLVPGGQTDHGDVPRCGAHHPTYPAPAIAHNHHNRWWPLFAIAAILQEGLTAAQIRVARMELVVVVVVVSLRAGRGRVGVGGGQGRRNGQLLAAGFVVVTPGHCGLWYSSCDSGGERGQWLLLSPSPSSCNCVFYYCCYYWNFPFVFAFWLVGYFRLFICKLICFLVVSLCCWLGLLIYLRASAHHSLPFYLWFSFGIPRVASRGYILFVYYFYFGHNSKSAF